jgi:NAD(P)-dependent dehydrogenase (short-subunit alcohol dehydrogenase family)
MDIANSSALITGASRGLGRALATTLARQGACVALVARDPRELDQAVAAIRAEGGTAYALPADVGDKHAIYPLAGEAAALIGPIDLLINNASTLGPVPLQLLLDTPCEELEAALAVNLVGPFRLSKSVLGSMLVRQRGVIVNITSDAATEAYPSWGAYGTSKAALDQLTRIWARELGDDSPVRIFAVDPGEMDTTMHAQAMPDANPADLARPSHVAERIVQMIRDPARAQNGARLNAAQWRTS